MINNVSLQESVQDRELCVLDYMTSCFFFKRKQIKETNWEIFILMDKCMMCNSKYYNHWKIAVGEFNCLGHAMGHNQLWGDKLHLLFMSSCITLVFH